MQVSRIYTMLPARSIWSPLSRSRPAQLRTRAITTSPTAWSNRNFPPRPKAIPDEDFTEVFLKGTGPGGQKINKTSSAVQLKHLPTGLVLKVQATRSRTQNRKLAREMLAARVDELEHGTDSRAAKVREVKSKRKASSAKKSRRKYRALEDAKRNEDGAEAAVAGGSGMVEGLAEGETVSDDSKRDGA